MSLEPGSVCPTCGQQVGSARRRLLTYVGGGVGVGTVVGLVFTYWWFGEDGFRHWMGLLHVASGAILGLIPGLALGLRSGGRT